MRSVIRGSAKPKFHAMSVTHTRHPFTSALLLVDAESNAAVDRRALREAGLTQIRVLTSGIQAARLLAGLTPEEPAFRPDVVFCHRKMADMEGFQLAELLRMHPYLLTIPLVVVAGNNVEAARIDALALGFSALLARPYSQDELHHTLEKLGSPSDSALHMGHSHINTGAFDAALRQYEASLAATDKPETAFTWGLQQLHARDWDGAIQSFQRAMRQIALKGEAELGLAAAWRGKGDTVRYTHYLNEAAHTFARATQWHKARVAYARLLRTAPEAPSPFLNVAESLIRAERFEDAVEALAAGYDLGPSEDTPDRLAQACFSTTTPDRSLAHVWHSLAASPLAEAATALGNDMRKAFEDKTLAAQARSRALRERQIVAHKGIAPRADSAEYAPPGDGLADLPEMSSPRDKAAPVLAPLQALREDAAASSCFTSIPVLNEALTVAKVTWQLLRSSRR